jgi:hypothetical protein
MIDDPHFLMTSAFVEPTDGATAAASVTKTASGELVDDSHCGGRGCCDDQVMAKANLAKPINWTQLIPEVAAASFGLGMCCVWVAGRKSRRMKRKSTWEEEDSD